MHEREMNRKYREFQQHSYAIKLCPLRCKFRFHARRMMLVPVIVSANRNFDIVKRIVSLELIIFICFISFIKQSHYILNFEIISDRSYTMQQRTSLRGEY